MSEVRMAPPMHHFSIMPLALVKDHSPLRCRHCKQHYTHQQEIDLSHERLILCSRCGNLSESVDEVDVAIEPDSVQALDIDGAKSMMWYHITSDPDWLDSVTHADDLPWVHVGTKDAAMSRSAQAREEARADTQRKDQKWYLYEVCLRPDCVVAQQIVRDTNEWPTHLDESTGNEVFEQVNRYVNVWECPGSISLLLDPRAISHVNRTDFVETSSE